MKLLLIISLLIPSLSWSSEFKTTREEFLEKLDEIKKENNKKLTFEEFKNHKDEKIVDENFEKRNIWMAKCYLDARKDAEVASNYDALFVKDVCRTLGYEKFPNPNK